MALFRTVKSAFWEDEKVIDEFSPEDRYFFLYLLTNPHSTQLGIYKFVPRIAAFHLGYSIESVKTLIERFENSYKMIRFSHSTNEIAIKNYLRHSIIKGGKPVLDCLKKEERDVQNKDLVYYVVNHVSKDSNINNTVRQFIEYFNEKENENENENERYEGVTYNVTSTLREVNSKPNSNSIIDEDRITSKDIVNLYHELCPSLPKVRKMTQKRASAINARLRTYGIDEIKECFTKAEKSKFLKGGNDRNWNADFDWLMKESNMAKVLEGKYDDREAPVKQVKNSFNNFEQRTYDYEALEKKLHAKGRQNVRHLP